MSFSYLKNMPQEYIKYGLNKTLITRALTIDFKHRDTEMNFRSPHLLKHFSDTEIREIIANRSQQFRFIYHIYRNAFDNVSPDDLVMFLDFLRKRHFDGFGGKIGNLFIDFDVLLKTDFSQKIKILENAMIFSFKTNQVAMINFFIKHKLPLPRQFMIVNNFGDLKQYLNKAITVALFHPDTLNYQQQLYGFFSNYHFFKCYGVGKYESMSFKTDTPLDMPVIY